MAIWRSDVQTLWQDRTESKDCHATLNRLSRLAAPILFVLSSHVGAAKWEVVPKLVVGETYTDNVFLVPEASKQSDWVTQVLPGITVTGRGANLQFDAEYNPEILYFAQSGYDEQVFQRGRATGVAELANERFFADFGATVDQYDASIQSPITTSNVNPTGNRSTVGTYYLSPYYREDFGSKFNVEARFTESIVRSDEPSSFSTASSTTSSSLSNSTSERIDLRLQSGPAYKRTIWGVEYNKESIDYKNAPETSIELISANARRLVSPTVGLLARIGHESYESGEVASDTEGPSWSMGFDWTPSRRTRFTATAGHRFYGDDYLMEFSHRTRVTAWTVGYTENVTTNRTEFFVGSTTSATGYIDTLFTSQYADPEAREHAVADFVASTGMPSTPTNFFSNKLLLVKKWEASAGILGIRNILIANVFTESSESLDNNLAISGTDDFAASSSINQAGGSVLWNSRITSRVAWNLNLAYSRNEFPDTGRADDLVYVGMGLTRQLQPRLWGSLNYRRQQRDSNVAEGEYTENALIATIQKRF